MSDAFPRQINDNFFILGNEYFHVYLIIGRDTCALVETGISATASIVLDQLSSIKAAPDFLIVTHPHSDHITGLGCLRDSFLRAAVITGNGAQAFINHPKSEQSMIAEDIHMTQSLAVRGISRGMGTIKSVPPLSGCLCVKDDEEINLGELEIDFLEAKGHSPANILVYISEMKTLLASDSLGNLYPGRGFFPTFFTGFTDYMETIDRLEKINPGILGIAHNGLFSTPQEIRNIFQKARSSATDVKNYVIHDQRSDNTIAKDLFDFYYTDELAIYSPQNILNCCRLLVRRVREFV